MAIVKRWSVAFGRFWWEFLIGENPDAFFGVLLILGSALLLRHDRAAAIVVEPLLALAVLVGSVYRGRKRTTNAAGGNPTT